MQLEHPSENRGSKLSRIYAKHATQRRPRKLQSLLSAIPMRQFKQFGAAAQGIAYFFNLFQVDPKPDAKQPIMLPFPRLSAQRAMTLLQV